MVKEGLMGDVSAEPSMEDILSSIKRIIADEGGEPAPIRPPRRAARPPRPIEPVVDLDDEPYGEAEVLELDQPIAEPVRAPAPPPPPAPVEAAMPSKPAAAPAVMPEEPIVSRATAAATRGSLDALSRMLVKPEASGDGTLEGLVREMLRPMLRDWLDANLPPMVEQIVEREIAKIIGAPR